MSEGKVSPGQDFNPPPAAIWNNMVDAGRAWADDRLNQPAGLPTRPRETDIIKVKNDCGAARRKGEILKIDGKAIETVADEQIWLLGKAVTADCYFGILKRPAEIAGVESLQVSGVCIALVDIIDAYHTRACAIAGSYVLESSDSGPLEILYTPDGLGEKDCVVRFATEGRHEGILLDDMPAAVNTKRDPSTARVRVLRKQSSGDLFSSSTIYTITNRFKNISAQSGTYVKFERMNGEWQLYCADCPSEDSSGSV